MFKPRDARKSLSRYRRKGLDKIERRMVASVPAAAIDGARILEIGGGIGAIQAEFLAAGADRGEIVELVPAYEPYARELAHEKGLESRSTFRVADILDEPEAVAQGDIVILNRVVCCSPDGIQLTGVAARHAERVLLVSFPRDRFLVRAVAGLMNGLLQLAGRSFRVFVHPRASLYAAAQAEGLVLGETGHRIAWEFAAFRRVEAGRQMVRGQRGDSGCLGT
jgi:magnesium-protoporphyrin O-methyltransferase